MNLTDFQKKLCNALQNGPLATERPFEEIAKALGSDEASVISEIKKLIETGIVRRISATINYRALGNVSSLIAAHVEQSEIEPTAAAVNKLFGVSHNYLREHFYNLWFTLQAASYEQIETEINKLKSNTGIEFHSLPAVQTFKLDVHFDAESGGRSLLACNEQLLPFGVSDVNLSDREKLIIRKLQSGIEIVARPFGEEDLKITKNLIEKGVIRHISAAVDYHRLGFNANAMFACAVEERRMLEVGKQLANLNNVSHCYQRKTFPGWAFGLFGMMHGHDMEQLEKLIEGFTSAQHIREYALLKTLKEFKKEQVRIG